MLKPSIFAKLNQQTKRLVHQVLLFVLFLTIAVLPVAAQLPNQPIQAQSNSTELLRQGKAAYDQGQYDEAVRVLQQAEKSGDTLQQAIVLSNLSLVYQQQGEWTQAETAINRSLELLHSKSDHPEKQQKLLAAALEVQGKLQLAIGQPEAALETWQAATSRFEQVGDDIGATRTQIHQSLALQELGQYRQAWKVLLPIVASLQHQPSSSIKAMAFQALGDVLYITGDTEEVKQSLDFLQVLDNKLAAERTSAQVTSEQEIELSEQQILQGYGLLQAQELLHQSLNILTQLKSTQSAIDTKQDEAKVYLSLGNTMQTAYYRARDTSERALVSSLNDNELEIQLEFLEAAVRYYQQAVAIVESPMTKIQAQLNQLSLLVHFNQRLKQFLQQSTNKTLQAKAQHLAAQLQIQPEQLPDLESIPAISRASIYARVNLARSLMNWYASKQNQNNFPNSNLIQQHLEKAIEQARFLQDKRAEAYAIGNLAEFYEKARVNSRNEDLSQKALQQTQKALRLSETIQATDLTYQWQWQLGRILKQKGRIQEAIVAYEEAVKNLDVVRQDLSSLGSSDAPFSFRDSVEPIYRELVSLLLQSASASSQNINSKQVSDEASSVLLSRNLLKARRFIQELQVLELENFLRCRVQNAVNLPIDQAAKDDPDAAFIYPILLDDRLEILLKLPTQNNLIQRITYVSPTARNDIETTIQNFREGVERGETGDQDQSFGQLYDWLFRPIEVDLQQSNLQQNRKIKTLVFVMDSALRNIPLAALYDNVRQEYLIEKGYGIVLNLGLELIEGKPLQAGRFKVLAAGVSQENLGAGSLPYVKNELKQITDEVQGSVALLDAEFTSSAFQERINSTPFPVIHIATHGVFSGNPANTRIYAYQEAINLNQIRDLLRRRGETRPEPIELLVLSACQTAIGDTRASLGIAGVSVQAGARSTIATLFNVNDASTAKMMKAFYQKLGRDKLTKAEVLRQAQLTLWQENDEYKKPYYWAPFVLVGNWR